MTDFIDLNGSGWAYTTYIMENGDKILAQGTQVAHRLPSGDGKPALKNMTANTIVGGTGRFQHIRGVVRIETSAVPSAGIKQSNAEMEYWFEK